MALSCSLFEQGTGDFRVVLGDANLNIDLPFGVQTHEIMQVIVHEDYRPEDKYHYQDIGLIKLNSEAKLMTTVCLLCLPEDSKDFANANCTVTGYGRPSTNTAFNSFEEEGKATDGILRKADLPIVETSECADYLNSNARSDQQRLQFICAGGIGQEESCWVNSSEKVYVM